MGRRKDAERRKRREQRMAERMQQTLPHQETYFLGDQQDAENDTGSIALEDSPVSKTVLMGERIITDSRSTDVTPCPATNSNPIKDKFQNSRSTKNISDEFKAGMDLILGTSY